MELSRQPLNDLAAQRLQADCKVDHGSEAVNANSARWAEKDDGKRFAMWRDQAERNRALDHSRQLIYIAATGVNLQMAMAKYAEVQFHRTRVDDVSRIRRRLVLNRSVGPLGFVLVGLATLLLSSCASMEKSQKSDGLTLTSLRYAKALRWGDYPGAMKMTTLRDGEVDDVDLEYLKNIKVTRYDVSPAVMNEDQTIGYTRLHLEYYNEFVNSVHTLTVDQTWRYDEAFAQWLCETPMPKFKP